MADRRKPVAFSAAAQALNQTSTDADPCPRDAVLERCRTVLRSHSAISAAEAGRWVARAESLMDEHAWAPAYGQKPAPIPDRPPFPILPSDPAVDPVASAVAANLLFTTMVPMLRQITGPEPVPAEFCDAVVSLQQRVTEYWRSDFAAYDAALPAACSAASEARRQAVAREVHDRISGGVNVAMRQLELYLHDAVQAGGEAPDSLVAARDALVEALEELRDLIVGLRRSRTGMGLRTALEAYALAMKMTTPKLVVKAVGEEAWAPADIVAEVYLIVRECIRNTVAHARAETITIVLTFTASEISVTVEDDGTGIDLTVAAGKTTSYGLVSMAERAELLGGRLSVERLPSGRGTMMDLQIPVPGY